jgi:hypothetical protein
VKWLVVPKKQVDREKVLEQLRAMNCEILAPERRVSLGAGEEVLSVEGPSDLPKQAEQFKHLMAVYPNSKKSAY